MLTANADLVHKVAFVLLIIGALNWGVTAYRMKADDHIPDALDTIHEEFGSSVPVDKATLQRAVYAAVAVSALLLAAKKVKEDREE